MRIKFGIFDVGQVCYPYSLDPLNAYCRKKSGNKRAFDAKGGVKSFDYDPFMKGEINFDGFCRSLCLHCEMEYGKEAKIAFNREMHRGAGGFFDETLAAMDSLRKNGAEICLLSNALPNLQDTACMLAAAHRTFTSYELGLLKPDPEIYRAVLRRLKANPEEVLFIDDKPKNVAAACSLGIRGIVFTRETVAAELGKILNRPEELKGLPLEVDVDFIKNGKMCRR